VPGDSIIYLLNPQVVASDGEWEAWRFAHWIPGAERFPSFELLMRSEHELFLQTEGKATVTISGPFGGPYAPDQPRREATRIGPGRRKPVRLTVPQLIAQLESTDRRTRLAAAKQLFREFCPHSPEDEHPELVEPLSRILKSNSEPEVRGAAAAMLGSYGDEYAIPPLLDALEDAQVIVAAIGSLSYLSIYMKDSRIGDALIRLLNTPRDHYITEQALYILEEIRDPRIAEVGLRLLDGDLKLQFNFPNDFTNSEYAERYQTSSMQFAGAFAFAKFAANPTPELLSRMTHTNSSVRAAAVAALREDKNRGPQLKKFVEPLIVDPDEGVRHQASMTLRFLEPLPAIEISPEQLQAIEKMALEQLQRAAKRRKHRFD
jgi:HEAT repeat protein